VLQPVGRLTRISTRFASVVCAVLAIVGAGASSSAGGGSLVRDAAGSTVWLCRPGVPNDPCTSSLATTIVQATGSRSLIDPRPAARPRFDCFYVYPTVSRETTPNSNLAVQQPEVEAATAQASRFSTVCRVFAPMYRQVTLAALAGHPALDVPTSYERTAYDSLLAGFDDYLAHFNDGRPIVFIGHSQGAAILINLLARVVDGNAGLRNRLVLAIILGGDVEVRTGSLTGGSFVHIPLCSRAGEHGCVIAYSSFPGQPPASSLFGRPGQGVALQSGQTAAKGVQVACVNPASLGGGSARLDPYFPSLGLLPTPWAAFPGLYAAACKSAHGATWLQVDKATGRSDKRPVVTEQEGAEWGYHTFDVNLALGNLVDDVRAAEQSWAAAPNVH
jgi:Protein of unknown function (DUF3089)